MRLSKILSLIIFVMVLAENVSAQIYSPAADDSFAATYNLPEGTDKVFVYNHPQYKAARTASIVAVSTDRLTGWNFQWAVYDQTAQLYTPLPGSTMDWFSIMDTITVSSGYQVTMTKGITTNIFRVWLIFNDYQVRITNKDADNKLEFGYYNCSSLDLRADTTLVPGYYFNPVTKARINVFNNYSIRWKTDNSEASTPSSRLITRVSNPPSEDTWYILTLTDRFDLRRSDSVFYKSIQSDAKIEGAYINLSDSLEYSGHRYGSFYANDIKSAPGKYRFDISSSRNTASYSIDFGDGESMEGDSLDAKIVHEFKYPGKYKIMLTTKSDKPDECPDSATAEAELVYGDFALPNVFSPNNDGYNDQMNLDHTNDMFRSEDVSVVTIDITIFDRAGRKVHVYAGNMRDWTGWDGNVMHSNREAPEGVYYYVISALFYFKDPIKPINNGVYKGFFHLYRE